MKNSTFKLKFKDLGLSVSQIENVIGYKEGENREIVTDLIEEILKESEKICHIKAQYIIFKNIQFDQETSSVEINNIRFNINKIIFRQIKKAESVAIFLCTAGEEIGIRSKAAMKDDDLLKGYIYDVVGSEIVESAADLMQNELENNMISCGKNITNRYSPGYCGWDVAEQRKLFQLIPDNYCGISLTESALMTPIKSISGIIGIGEKVKRNPYSCQMCNLKDCIYRKAKERI